MNRFHTLTDKLPKMEAAMITNPISRRYFSGIKSSDGTLVVTGKKSVLIIDSRYYEMAQRNALVDEVILQDKLYRQIAEVLNKNGVSSVAVEADFVTLSQMGMFCEKLPGIEICGGKELSAAIAEMRETKSPDEIEKIKAAQKLTDETFAYILEYIEAGMTEREIALEMEFYGRKEGADDKAFDFIVAAGPNGSMPHAVPSEYKVKPGDFITMDFGFQIDGYHSDMTRTIALGNPGTKQREVYDLVLKAQLKAMEVAKSGVKCSDVDKAARDLIDNSVYKGCFGHGLGHAIGLEVHENPRFSPKSDAIWKTGSVMSDEPGIYIPGEFGVRIEDLIVATEDGYENLTHSPKELIVL